jgi:WASH complex subunit strumpellin
MFEPGTESRQLMCEALYLLGVQLLIIDEHIPGPVRERCIVAYYRYCAGGGHLGHGHSNVDDVCALMRATGYDSSVG